MSVGTAVLLERAFVFSVSARAVLAVAALALSVTFALVAGGAVSGIDAEGASYDEARANPGRAVFDNDFASFPAAQVPSGATRIDWTFTDGGAKVATVDPWPREGTAAVLGPYAGEPELAVALDTDLPVENATLPYAPLDALVLPPSNYSALLPDRADQARVAFVPGTGDGDVATQAVPWRGVAHYFEAGAAQIAEGLAILVLVTGAVATLLSSGLVYLEVAARSRDLATVKALAGPSVVRRLIVMRTLVLVAGGLVAGTAAAFLILRLARTAVPGLAGNIPFTYLAATWLVVGLGASTAGILAGLRAGRRATLRSTGGAAVAVRRFPGPVSFLVVTPRLFASVVAASAVTVAILGVVMGTVAIPDRIFGGADASEVYIAEGGGNPLRATVDRFLATHAHVLDEVDAVLPETYAPSIWNGHPLMVKGTDLALWQRYTDPLLREGAWPTAPGEGTLGIVKARATGIGVGDTLVLPASYHVGVEQVRIVGVHTTGGIEDDQLFVDLDTAGRLAGIPADKATGIRARLADPETKWADIATSGIQVAQLRISPDNPVALTPAVATFTVINFDPQPRARTIDLRVNGGVETTFQMELEGHSTRTFQLPFTVPNLDRLVVEINPTTQVQTSQGNILLETPDVARPGESFEVTVKKRDGDPVADAQILVDGAVATRTNGQGRAALTIREPTLATLSVQSAQGSGGVLLRVAPPEWDDGPYLVNERIHVGPPSAHDDESFKVDVHVTLANLGGQRFNGTVAWTVEGNDQANRSVVLESGRRAPFQAGVTVPYGGAIVAVLDGSEHVDAARPSSPDAPPSTGGAPAPPRTIEDVLAEKRAAATQAREVGAGRTSTFLTQVFATLQDAALVIVLVTLAHGGTLVWVSVLREVRERDAVVRLLHDLGADGDQVRRRAVRDVVLAVTPALVAGLALAAMALKWAAAYGFPAAFGHTLPGGRFGLFLRTGLVLLAIAVLAAIYGVHRVGGRSTLVVRPRPLGTWLEHEP